MGFDLSDTHFIVVKDGGGQDSVSARLIRGHSVCGRSRSARSHQGDMDVSAKSLQHLHIKTLPGAIGVN
jgi:hypothetical protein